LHLPLDSFGKGLMFLGCSVRSFILSDIVTTICHKQL